MTGRQSRWPPRRSQREEPQYRQEEPQYPYPQASAQLGGPAETAAQQQPPQPFGPEGGQPLPAAGGEQGGGQQPVQQGRTQPPVDIVEMADELRVYVDAPGFEEDEIHIHADANTLVVSADRTETVFDPENGERGLLVERPTRLERSVQLPVHIDPENASASFENGVCVISISKEESDQRREIGFQ